METWSRVAVGAVLLGAVIGMVAYHDTARTAHEQYPTPTEIERNYSAHVGERVLLWGSVESITEGKSRVTIHVLTGNGTMPMDVSGFNATVQPGGNVQVYGTLETGHSVTAINVVTVNSTGSSRLYKYLVSAVGALLVVGQFFRYWRIDTDAVGFEVRSDG